MNDTLAIKDLVMSTVGATQLPGSARNFPRTVSKKANEFLRQSMHISSLSPTTVRVAHTPRASASEKQRSLFAVDQVLTRLDASSNPVSSTSFKVAFQCDIPSDVTLAEYRTAVSLLLGALLESDGAVVTALYNGEY